MTHSRLALPAVLLALALASCGGSERAAEVRDAVPASASTATATEAPPATTAESTPGPSTTPATGGTGSTATTEPQATAPASAPDAGGASAGETQPGGAGDEEPIRQPARFVLDDADVQPASIAVAPFLAVALTVVNRDPASHAVRLVGTTAAFDVPPGGQVSRRLPGLKAGMYTLAVDGGKAAASLVVGDDVGP